MDKSLENYEKLLDVKKLQECFAIIDIMKKTIFTKEAKKVLKAHRKRTLKLNSSDSEEKELWDQFDKLFMTKELQKTFYGSVILTSSLATK